NVRFADVHKDSSHREGVLRLYRHRALTHVYGGHLPQRNLNARHGRHDHLAKLLHIVTQLPGIPNIDAVALATLDSHRGIHSADRGHDCRVDLTDVKAVPCRLCAPNVDVHVIPGNTSLREGTPGAGHVLKDPFHSFTERLQGVEIGTEDLDANRGTDPCGQHVDPALDRHRPGIGHTGEAHG